MAPATLTLERNIWGTEYFETIGVYTIDTVARMAAHAAMQEADAAFSVFRLQSWERDSKPPQKPTIFRQWYRTDAGWYDLHDEELAKLNERV